MSEPAPPYAGEAAHALWHVSEDPTIARFEPHLRPEHAADEPLELVELGDLLALHVAAGIELRIAPELLMLWDKVINSTLDFSGIRLRNATLSA